MNDVEAYSTFFVDALRTLGWSHHTNADDVEIFKRVIAMDPERFEKYKNHAILLPGTQHENKNTLAEYFLKQRSHDAQMWLFCEAGVSFFESRDNGNIGPDRRRNRKAFCSLLDRGIITLDELYLNHRYVALMCECCDNNELPGFLDTLLGKGFDFNRLNGESSTIWEFFSQYTNTKEQRILDIMVKVPIDPDVYATYDGNNILHGSMYCMRHEYSLQQKLFELYPHLLVKPNHRGYTPLENFVKDKERHEGHFAFVFEILDNSDHKAKAGEILSRQDMISRLHSRFVKKIIEWTGNEELAKMKCRWGYLPVNHAIISSNQEVAEYFYNLTEDGSNDAIITADSYHQHALPLAILGNTLFEWQKDISKFAVSYSDIKGNNESFNFRRSVEARRHFAPRLFTWALLLREGYLSHGDKSRFWRIVCVLPIEVLMRLCNLFYGADPDANISSATIAMYLPLMLKRIKK